jgi:PhnB protein
MRIMPYIHFQGTCREAMITYAKLFVATDLQLMTYAEMPEGPESFSHSDRIMHSQFSVDGGWVMMASDYPPGNEGELQGAFSVMIGPKTVARARQLFDALSDGGQVFDPFKPNFFSPGFGMVQDRFGTHWIISAEGP